MANKCIKCTGRSEALISLVTVNIAVKDLLKHNIEVYKQTIVVSTLVILIGVLWKVHVCDFLYTINCMEWYAVT